MKYLVFVFMFVFVFSCTSIGTWFNRKPAATEPRQLKHYVFTVHGIAGDSTTFGEMLPVLKNNLELVDQNYQVITKTFLYKTGKMNSNVPAFVKTFGTFLTDFFSKNSLDENDKISIISHSQGGLITTLWYVQTFSENNIEQQEIAKHVENIVAIATPFWGSGVAHIVNDKLPYEWVKNLVYKFMSVGKQEVRDMSPASDKIFDFYRDKAASTYELLKSPHVLNIAGVAPGDAHSKRLNIGERWESDKAVNVSSARLDFYYYSDSIYKHVFENTPTTVELRDFNYSQYFSNNPKYKIFEGAHTTMSDHIGLAVVPKQCIDPIKCNQPTYVEIFRHLAGCEVYNSTCDIDKYNTLKNKLYKGDQTFGSKSQASLMNSMRTFQLGLSLGLPKNFIPPKNLMKSEFLSRYIKTNYTHGSSRTANKDVSDAQDALIQRESPDQDYRVQLGRFKEWGSRISKYSQDANQVNIQMTGNVKPTDSKWATIKNTSDAWSEKIFSITITVDIPGLKKRIVTLPIRPTYTTFIELELEKQN